MKSIIAAATIACVMQAGAASGQSLTTFTTEASVTTGVTSEEKITAAAVQLRAFGEIKGGIRFFTEAAWGVRSDEDSDAFGAAYPYAGQVQMIEAFGERLFRPGRAVIAVRAGRYRTPFGISNGSDHAYSGFLRAPLIRYDGHFALSNNFLEHGVGIVAGIPRLTVEASIGRPADVGSAVRRPGSDAVVRVQSFVGPLIVGVSHIQTPPYMPERFAAGRSVFTGVDLRWMHEGVQLRGEWIAGQPFDGGETHGWYADAIVHRAAMGPVTAVARLEQLVYNANRAEFDYHARRHTAGARIRILEGLSVQVNLIHQTGELTEYGGAAFDVGVTYSRRHDFHRN